jgi:CDP-glycerol glycerophosphotransferase (TagB/SpsB family)
MKNSQAVRFGDKIHVQLLHGESDKPPSYNPVTAMFDEIYVAGQGGIDRYAQHGVDIPDEKFRIVGRPQVEKVRPGTSSITEAASPLVLYAPTWQGFYDDTSLTSLPYATQVVEGLLELGARVIFRPHPYSFKHAPSLRQINDVNSMLAKANSAGGEHLFGDKATAMSLFDTFNAVDGLVTDVSSVAADFLFSGKPFAVVDVGDPAVDPLEEYPMMRAGYLLRPQLEHPREQLTVMIQQDPMLGIRQELRTYYLGDIPADTYAEVFLEQVRTTVADGESRRQGL